MERIIENYTVEIERDRQTGRVIAETWLDEEKMPHRLDGPAHIEFDASGRTICEQWKKHGQIHRDKGLRADCAMNEVNSVIFYEAWCEDGDLHRLDDLPAEIQRCPDTGRTTIEIWAVQGNIHRSDNKPALIEYGENGCIIRSEWYERGMRHNTIGPAVITYAEDGSISSMEHYRCGQRVSALNPSQPKLG